MNKKKKWNSLKVISLIVTGIFFASLIPLLQIGEYNFPSSDDFSMGMAARQVWEQSHSFFFTIIEACRHTGRLYMGWAGTFSTLFLMTITPAIFGREVYIIVPYLMIGLLSFSMWYFIWTVMVVRLHADKHITNIISMIVLFYTIQGMPSAVEAYYWYNGAVHYIFPYSFLLLFLSIIINNKEAYIKGKYIGKLFFLSLLGIFIGGGNYMTALLAIILCCLIIIKWAICKDNRKAAYLIPFAFTLIAFLLNIFAPGNSVRQSVAAGYDPVKAIYMSFVDCFLFVWDYALGWKTFCLILLLLPFCWILVKNTNFSFKYPVLVLLCSFCVMSSIFAPCLYGIGNVIAGRLQNTIYITFMILLVTNLIYILGWISRKINCCFSLELLPASRQIVLFFTGASLITMVFSFLLINKDPCFFNVTSAINSLQNGQAAKYGDECQERLVLLLDQEQKDIELHPFTDPPYLLFFEDITDDVTDWRNKAICDFYGKDSAILLKE